MGERAKHVAKEAELEAEHSAKENEKVMRYAVQMTWD
jgi:hypothetical protein